MLGKDDTKKIIRILTDSCKQFFLEKLTGSVYPENLEVSLQITRDSKHGDLTSNVAMRLAKAAKRSPVEIGRDIVAVFERNIEKEGLASVISGIELKGGFINLRLSDEYYKDLLNDIYTEKGNFGKLDLGHGKRINLEYVSANPTGPLTIAHGRQAAVGDALSRILKFSGYDVTDEYYLNDYGRQIKMLGMSVDIRYRQLFGKQDELPEDSYLGEYITDIAKEIKQKKGDSLLDRSDETEKYFREYAVDYMMKLIRKDLNDFGVSFDVWTSQAGLEDRNEVADALELLDQKGFIYDQDGAKWFASSRLGDDKDRVVIKSEGTYTYLAPDIAYHRDKYSRGFDKLIDFLGPDHHGYINRMKAAVQAMGKDPESLDMIIVQLVTLMRGGETVSMSTRKGEFISLREILDEIGKDVTRFFFLSRRLDSHLDFDIDLAKKESSDNPVYYIQYAHARICSINRHAEEKSISSTFNQLPALDLFSSKEEKKLIRKMSEFPFAVQSSAEFLEPNKLIVYLNELARNFHSFYTECQVVSDNVKLSKARLFLVECVKIVLANGLGLLYIDFPEKM